MGLRALGKGDWRGISRHFVQTRTPTQVASHAQKYFIRLQNTHKRKRRASLFDIPHDPNDKSIPFPQALENGGYQVPGSNGGGSATTKKNTSLTKMLKNQPAAMTENNERVPLDSREEESMRTLANMVLTHDARQQKNNNTATKQKHKQKHGSASASQQRHQQQKKFQDPKEYSNGHPIAGQFFGAASPPQMIPMPGQFYYNPMFLPPQLVQPSSSPKEYAMFPPVDASVPMNVNDLMASLHRNSAAYQQQQQMIMASAMAAGIHPSLWTAQYNMMLSGQNPQAASIVQPPRESSPPTTTSTAETEKNINGVTSAAVPQNNSLKISDSFTSIGAQAKESTQQVDASGIHRPIAGYPSRTEWLGVGVIPQQQKVNTEE